MKKYAWLLPYIKPYTIHLIIVLILSLVSTAFSLSYPYFTSLLIDDVLINRTYSLTTVVSLAFCAMVLGYVLSAFNSLLYLHVTLQMLRKLRSDLFLRIQRTKYRFFVHRKVGDIITRLNGDAQEVQSGLTDTILQAIIQISTLIFVTAMLFWLNYKLALLCFLFIPILVWAIVYFRPRIVHVSKELRKKHSTLQSFLIERLNGIKLIKFTNAEERVANEFDGQVKSINNDSFRYSLLSTLGEGIPRMAIIVCTTFVFGIGGHLVLTDALTIGELVAFTGYQARLFGPVQSIAALYMRLQRMNVSLQRLEELVQQTEEEVYERGKTADFLDSEKILSMHNVSFSYQREKPLLQNADFSLNKGEMIALIGPSGIGKSTLVDLITGLYSPARGEIFFQGRNIEEIPLSALRKKIAVATQQAPLFNGTILENIRFSNPSCTLEEITEVLKIVGLYEEIASMKDGYDTMIGERGQALSGGQRQRIALARTLLKNAELYILDEAASEIDTESETEIYRKLRRHYRSKSFIIISHRSNVLNVVDHVWLLENQRLIRMEGDYERKTIG